MPGLGRATPPWRVCIDRSAFGSGGGIEDGGGGGAPGPDGGPELPADCVMEAGGAMAEGMEAWGAGAKGAKGE